MEREEGRRKGCESTEGGREGRKSADWHVSMGGGERFGGWGGSGW